MDVIDVGQGYHASKVFGYSGWSVSALGLVATGMFAGLATTNTPGPWSDGAWKGFTGGGVGLSAAVAALGVYFLARSSAADTAAAGAIRAMDMKDDDEGWKHCIEVRAKWGEANAAATDEARQALKDAAGAAKDKDKKEKEEKAPATTPTGATTAGAPTAATGRTPPSQ